MGNGARYCAGVCCVIGADGVKCKGVKCALGGMLCWRCGCGGNCKGGGEPVENMPEAMSALSGCQRLIGGRCNWVCNGGPTDELPTGPGGGSCCAMLSKMTSRQEWGVNNSYPQF